MGITLLLAIIGFVMVLLGAVFFFMRKQRKTAIACWIAGLALIVLPYTLIVVFLD